MGDAGHTFLPRELLEVTLSFVDAADLKSVLVTSRAHSVFDTQQLWRQLVLHGDAMGDLRHLDQVPLRQRDWETQLWAWRTSKFRWRRIPCTGECALAYWLWQPGMACLWRVAVCGW
jgi:hypothetical protein